MENVSLLMILIVMWGGITVVLIGFVIYRAVVGIHEEDQLFLDRAETSLEREQAETLKQIGRLDIFIKGFGIVSGSLLLVIAAIWVYRGLFGAPPL